MIRAILLILLIGSTAFAQYIITGSGTLFTATKNGTTTMNMANQPIQVLINAIRSDANGNDISIQFGDGESVLDIGTMPAYFSNTTDASGTWGKIALSGKITSASTYWNGTIGIGSNVSVNSEADIANTANSNYAVMNCGTVNITGGTISGTNVAVNADGGSCDSESTVTIISGGTFSSTGYATIANQKGSLTITGGTISAGSNSAVLVAEESQLILGGSPAIMGKINVRELDPGVVSIITEGENTFNPEANTYTLNIESLYHISSTNNVVVTGGAAFADNFTIIYTDYYSYNVAVKGNDLILWEPYIIKYGEWYGLTSYRFSVVRYRTLVAGDELIQNVINAIRSDAKGEDAFIQFGDGESALNIGEKGVLFANATGTGGTWGKVTLSGKITSESWYHPYNDGFYDSYRGTVIIQTGVSVESVADIANTADVSSDDFFSSGGIASAICNYGNTSINGGIVSATEGNAVYNSGGTVTITGDAVVTSASTDGLGSGTIFSINEGLIEILGGTVTNTADGGMAYEYYRINYTTPVTSLVLGGSPTIIGNIRNTRNTEKLKLSVNNTFNPGTKTYSLMLRGTLAEGDVAVTGGAAFVGNFTLTNSGWGLAASGNDLVTIHATTPILNTTSPSGLGIVLNGQSLHIFGTSQATPLRIYNLRGNVVMSRTVAPNESVSVSHLPKGVYVARAGGIVVKVVR